MPALFNDFFSRDLWNWGLANNSTTNTTIPAINIREDNDNFYVEVAAPGMKKDDFTVELDGTTLTISSERQNQNEQKEGEKYSRKEFSYQSFQRIFELPVHVVDAEHIQAKYENGLLHLTVPKKEEAKQRPPRTIQIWPL
jgi:HSP20 family protein